MTRLPGRAPAADGGWELTETGDDVVASFAGVELFTFVTAAAGPAFDAPAPHLRVRSRAGRPVTDHRPADHTWHDGVRLGLPDVRRPGEPAPGVNLWGGNTYVPGEGYLALPERVGVVSAAGPVRAAVGPDGPELAHTGIWSASDGAPLLRVRHAIRARVLAEDAWLLGVDVDLENLAGADLTLGSPATNGVAGSGYCGLWWRGAPGLRGATVLTPAGVVPEGEALGGDGPWVGLAGDGATVVVAGAAQGWFVRSEQYPGIGPSPAFHAPVVVADRAHLALGLRLLVVDGAPDPDRIGALLETPPA